MIESAESRTVVSWIEDAAALVALGRRVEELGRRPIWCILAVDIAWSLEEAARLARSGAGAEPL